MKVRIFKRKKRNRIEEMIRENETEIEEDEREMIQGVFGLGETPVKTIMVPRTDVVAVSADMSFEDIVGIVVKSGHSRIPVYQGTIDNVIGFLYAKDLLAQIYRKKDAGIDINKIVRPALFVPEGKIIDELLKELRQKRVHIAVVVDEYGGMAGIVCLENILEEIVGKIQDEYDVNEEEEIVKLSPNSYLLDARTQLSDLNEELSLCLPLNGSDTVGGFVFNLFGKIPEVKEKISHKNIEFEIEQMDGRQIKKVRMSLRKPEIE
jgi:CBS domain containing-hemolysin-like protein